MAQVTMDSKEYIELLDKARAWDRLNERLVEETTVEVNEDYYRGYRIDFAFAFTPEAKMGITYKVAKALAESDAVMRTMVAEQTTVLDMNNGYVSRNWNDNKEHEADLMQVPEFKAKYEAISAEAEEEE